MNQITTPPLAESRLIMVPIMNLSPIPHGVRKISTGEITSLAASIKAEGLIQNLAVVVDAEAPFAGAEEFQKYTVIAGCRRLLALKHLAKSRELPDDYLVPCKLFADAQALSASLAENVERKPMHPHDEFIAFRDLHAEGHPIEDIAARFGVEPRVIERRLRLANVSPRLLELFRTTQEITLEQLMALAVVDDHAAQEKAWNDASNNHFKREPNALRDAITKKELNFADDAIARLVGIAEYEAAGGAVRRDLFSEDDNSYAIDARLLKKLAAQKLDAAAEAVKKEGWSWVEARAKLSHMELYGFSTEKPTSEHKLTDVERKRIAELQASKKSLDATLDALNENPEPDYKQSEKIEREIAAIDSEIDAIKESKAVYDPKTLTRGGAIVTVSDQGKIRVHRGLVRKKESRSVGTNSNAAKPDDSAMSHELASQLSRAIDLAAGAEMIANPGGALIALTMTLAASVFYNYRIEISRINAWGGPDLKFKGSADQARIETEGKALKALLPPKAADLLDWLRGQDGTVSLRILAFCIAVLTHFGRYNNDQVDVSGVGLLSMLNVDMRTRWQPTQDTYFGKASKSHLLKVLKDAGVNALDIAKAEKLKGPELAKFVQPKLVNWLPKMMRFGPAAAEPKVAAKETKPTAAKPKASSKAKPSNAGASKRKGAKP